MATRRAKSKVHRLDPAVRQYIEQLLRADRFTLDEILDQVHERFPGQEAPSRSGLHRYKLGFEELTARMREIDRAANALVGELGEGVGEKSGALLAQAVTTLVTNAALQAQTGEDLEIDDLRKLARAAKDAIDTRRISLAERQAIEKQAAERALRESRERVEALGRSGQIDPEALKQVIQAGYGLQ